MEFVTFELPKRPFQVSTLQKLHNDAKVKERKLKIEKIKLKLDDDNERYEINKKVIEYIQSYYYETSKGDYYFYEVSYNEKKKRYDDDIVLIDRKAFKAEVLDKIDDDYIQDKIKKNDKVFRLASDLFKPRVYEQDGLYYINICKGFLHKKYKHYNEYSDEIKEKVEIVLNMIKEVSCDDNDEIFEAYKKYLAQLCRGIKTGGCIYKKGIEGIGKSSETDFIMKYVLGEGICLLSNAQPIKSQFNKILLGKLLVVFEELPTMNENEWKAVSGRLKTLITEDITMYEDKNIKAFQAENISNFIINTNVEAIKDSDGRRYIIMPLSNKYKGNGDHFKAIKNECYNLEVGEAFYSYMMTIIDPINFNIQQDFPETENKAVSRANLLHPVFKFIKFKYILENKAINKISPSDLLKEYVAYCSSNDLRPLGKIDFYKKLKEVNIESKKINGYHYYVETIDKLTEIATTNKWLCKYDGYEKECDEETSDDDDDETEDEMERSKNEYKWKLKFEELERKYNKLLKRLNDNDK